MAPEKFRFHFRNDVIMALIRVNGCQQTHSQDGVFIICWASSLTVVTVQHFGHPDGLL